MVDVWCPYCREDIPPANYPGHVPGCAKKARAGEVDLPQVLEVDPAELAGGSL